METVFNIQWVEVCILKFLNQIAAKVYTKCVAGMYEILILHVHITATTQILCEKTILLFGMDWDA